MAYQIPSSNAPAIPIQLVDSAGEPIDSSNPLPIAPTPNRLQVFRNTSVQSFTNNVTDEIEWNGLTYKTGITHNTVTNPQEFTIPRSGRYIISVNVQFATLSILTEFTVRLMKNTSTVVMTWIKPLTASTNNTLSATCIANLSQNDVCFIDLKGVQSPATGNIQIATGATRSVLSVHEVY